jgi:hypothetical protein
MFAQDTRHWHPMVQDPRPDMRMDIDEDYATALKEYYDIVMSGSKVDAGRLRMRSAGCPEGAVIDVINKTFVSSELIKVVDEWLGPAEEPIKATSDKPILLLRGPGAGRTTACVHAISRFACKHYDERPRYEQAVTMDADDELLLSSGLLAIDDVGVEPAFKTKAVANVIAQRSDAGLRTIVTTPVGWRKDGSDALLHWLGERRFKWRFAKDRAVAWVPAFMKAGK